MPPAGNRTAAAVPVALLALGTACASRPAGPPTQAEMVARWNNERPECGEKLTERIWWTDPCKDEEYALWHLSECIVPRVILEPSPGGCELEDTVEEGLQEQGR